MINTSSEERKIIIKDTNYITAFKSLSLVEEGSFGGLDSALTLDFFFSSSFPSTAAWNAQTQDATKAVTNAMR